jgi:hypothetical protein
VADLESGVLEVIPVARQSLELAPDRMAVVLDTDEHARVEGRHAGADRPHVESWNALTP